MNKIENDKLLITSAFYSVQGEGFSTGVPSYFVRLGLCNLTCGLSRQHMNSIVKNKLLEDGEIIEGDLHEQGLATWTCDSLSQWAWRGVNQDFQYLIDRWKEEGIYEDIKSGLIHIIWTGGEPTIKKHQEAIINFHKYLVNYDNGSPIVNTSDINNPSAVKYYWNGLGGDKKLELISLNTFDEIETNGTIVIEHELFYKLSQINCSPKLSNSGMTEKQRIVPEAINRIMEHSNYQFKFVISNEDDIKEMFRDFIIPFNIPLQKVCCMPGMDSQDQFHERTQWVFEMAKIYKFRAASRMHISCWNKLLNV